MYHMLPAPIGASTNKEGQLTTSRSEGISISLSFSPYYSISSGLFVELDSRRQIFGASAELELIVAAAAAAS